MIWVLIAVILILGWGVYAYNRLIALRVRGGNAWADIDVQLKRRHDLVPNLVTTVEGYASHEKAIFEDVARYRERAINASGPSDSDRPEAALQSSIKSLFAIAENYPELRADQNFRKLQDQLSEVENNIQYSRRYYNAVVRDFNTAVETVPSNLIAGLFAFQRMSYFQAGDDERAPVTVDLGEAT